MRRSATDSFWRVLVHLWMRLATSSWRRLPVASDSPHVHAAGSYPDRILIAGDGASAGVGVATHDLGLPGYLARAISSLTGRAADVDITVTTDMTAQSCLDAIVDVRLSQYDVVLLSLGINEALDFEPQDRWEAELAALLDVIHKDSPASTKIVVLSIPYFGARSPLPGYLKRQVDRHAAKLNAASERVIARRADATFHEFRPGTALESDGAHAYQQWAVGIAPTVCDLLAPSWSRAHRDEPEDEAGRQSSLDSLGLLDMPPDDVLDEIATTTRDLFGTPMAAVTFIGADRQSIAAAIGTSARDVPRLDAFCNYTIRHPEHFVVEDAQMDLRFLDYPAVASAPFIRFYAGYPIETPDGHRVGSLCIMDVRPRRFTAQDAALLRTLAQQAQARLWVLGAEEAAVPV